MEVKPYQPLPVEVKSAALTLMKILLLLGTLKNLLYPMMIGIIRVITGATTILVLFGAIVACVFWFVGTLGRAYHLLEHGIGLSHVEGVFPYLDSPFWNYSVILLCLITGYGWLEWYFKKPDQTDDFDRGPL